MPKNPFSCLRRWITFIVILSSFNPKLWCEWKKEVDGRIIFAWIGMNNEGKEIKDPAEHQHIRSISFTTYVREKISHHLWRQNVCLQRNWCFNMRDCLKVSNCISHIKSIGTYLLLVSTIQKVISYLWIFSFQAQDDDNRIKWLIFGIFHICNLKYLKHFFKSRQMSYNHIKEIKQYSWENSEYKTKKRIH